eukprot:scaffold52103_cov60-Phaeocystis_antarctica.AAC.2
MTSVCIRPIPTPLATAAGAIACNETTAGAPTSTASTSRDPSPNEAVAHQEDAQTVMASSHTKALPMARRMRSLWCSTTVARSTTAGLRATEVRPANSRADVGRTSMWPTALQRRRQHGARAVRQPRRADGHGRSGRQLARLRHRRQ